MILVWVFAGVIALCASLVTAELASAYPHSGGPYNYIREAFGRLAAFLFGWMKLLILSATGMAGIAIVCAEYTLRAIGQYHSDGNNPSVRYLASAALAFLGFTNYVGLKWSSLVQNITTVLKVGGLMLVVTLALVLALPHAEGHFTASPADGFRLGAFGIAIISAQWAYSGSDNIGAVAGEVGDPKKHIAKSIWFAMLIIIAVYVLANVAYLAVLSPAQMAKSPLVAADIAEYSMGRAGLVFIAATVAVSTFGALNGGLLIHPRTFYAMARDGMFFPAFGRAHPKFETPHLAVAFVTIASITLVNIGDFEGLTGLNIIGNMPFAILAVLSLFVLRIKGDQYQPTYRVPLFPLIPIIALLLTIWLFITAARDETAQKSVWIGLGMMALGAIVYIVFGLNQKRRTV